LWTELLCVKSIFSHAKDARKSHCSIEQFLSYRSCFVWSFWWIKFRFNRSSFVCGLRGGDCSFCTRSAKAPVPCARSTGGQIQDLPQVFRRQCFFLHLPSILSNQRVLLETTWDSILLLGLWSLRFTLTFKRARKTPLYLECVLK
jgi:hypothetical protein